MNDETILMDEGLEPVPAEFSDSDYLVIPVSEEAAEAILAAQAEPVQDTTDTEGQAEVTEPAV